MYSDLEALLARTGADALLVDTCPPYHPEYLRGLPLYKVLRLSDGPMAAYDRDFAYIHAYDHVLYHSPAYSRDLDMASKLRYCGVRRCDFWPLALFDAAFDRYMSELDLTAIRRDIDVVFVGAFHVEKMSWLAAVKKYFGRRCVVHGLITFKRNAYFNLKYGLPGWITPIRADEYVSLYRRARVGFNIHNRGKYTIGNYRLFELPANGVMQISDGGEYLGRFFEPDREVVGYEELDEMIGKIDYYLTHESQRLEIALNGHSAVMMRHRFKMRMRELANLLTAHVADASSK
jgi:spore maturation protein CgeB